MQEPSLEDLCKGFKETYTAAITSVLDKKYDLRSQWLGPEIKPLLPNMQLAGPAFTIQWVNDPSPWEDEDWDREIRLLDSLQPFMVPIVETSKNMYSGYWGELCCNISQQRGVEGAVIDGGVRDSGYVLRIGFNMFASFTCPHAARNRIKSFQETIAINNITIRPGDFIIGDLDGVIVVPSEITLDVYQETRKLTRAEGALRRGITERGAGGQEYVNFNRDYWGEVIKRSAQKQT